MRSSAETDNAERVHSGCPLVRCFQAQMEARREEAGLSRRAFADRLGIPRSSYFHLMSEAANPSLDTVELIAERIGVSAISLFRAPVLAGECDDALRRTMAEQTKRVSRTT